MSDEKETPSPNEKPIVPKPPKNPLLKKAPINPFAKPKNSFTSPKAGNPGNKSNAYRGGGIKKGK